MRQVMIDYTNKALGVRIITLNTNRISSTNTDWKVWKILPFFFYFPSFLFFLCVSNATPHSRIHEHRNALWVAYDPGPFEFPFGLRDSKMWCSLMLWIIDNNFVLECYHSESLEANRVAKIILVFFSMQLKITTMSAWLNNMVANITVSIYQMVGAVVCVTMVTL